MAYGFKILNANGITQVDDTYSCYANYQSGTTTVPVNTDVTINFTNVGVVPMVFFKIRETNQRLMMRELTASSIMVRGDAVNTGSITLDWFTVVPSQYGTAATGTWGVIVRGADGTTVLFDSRKKYPRIRQVIPTGALDFSSNTEQTFTVNAMPSGAKPYFCANMLNGIVGNTPISGSTMHLRYASIQQASNTSIGIKLAAFGPIAGVASGDTYANGFQIVIADAT